MPINWNPNLMKIGIATIDSQHQELFDALNKFYDAFMQHRDNDEIIAIIDFLGDYIIAHFDHETSLMRESGYPDLEKHIFQHESFINTYQNFEERFETEGPTKKLMLTIYNSVYKWLVEHISASDKEYGNFLSKNK